MCSIACKNSRTSLASGKLQADYACSLRRRPRRWTTQVITALLDILHTARQLAKDTPPVDNEKSRFGNPAFKTFYDKINAQSASLHQRIPGLHQQYIPELCVYFNESWGNRERIDYGSGMELNFLCWLLALKKLGLIQKEDHTALVIRVFSTYLDDMRQLQETYWLEPAGPSVKATPRHREIAEAHSRKS